MPGAEKLPTGPVETPEQQRDRLLSETVRTLAKEGMKEWQTFPAEKRNEGVKRTYSRMISKLKTLQAGSADLVKNAELALSPLIDPNEDPAAAQRLEAIYEKIQADVPDYGEEPQGNTYFSRSEISPLKTKPGEPVLPEDMLSTYYIDNGSVLGKGDIRNDIEFLKTMMKPLQANSTESQALVRLIVHLEQMRLTDPRNAVAEEMQRQKGGDTYMDIAGKEMGRTALTLFLVAGTVIFGTIGLVQFLRKGEISFAPFLWGIAAYLMADPELLKTFFGKDPQVMKQFEQINTSTKSPELNRIVSKYKVGGPGWATAVEKLYEIDTQDELQGVLNTSDPHDDTILDVINDISGETAIKPGDNPPVGSIRGALLAMFRAKNNTGVSDFSIFARNLLAVEGADARTFIVTYVRNNAFKGGPYLDPKTGAALKGAAAAKASTGGK